MSEMPDSTLFKLGFRSYQMFPACLHPEKFIHLLKASYFNFHSSWKGRKEVGELD